MTHVRTWTVEINISEHEDERRTHADAILRGSRTVCGRGEARRRPSDREVPEIGDELASARALADLAYQLLDVAAGDIEQFTHKPVHLSS
ncbi:DUF1876 domain-containing protein [Nucisporomicrobium flavum]|jgi:Domain of unknown function (DUF1876)|uniref:DUF1876 domain-containing protein n=1 Tax=Nucisporomicrobium flavum TaxID=2785915 RepID=UPI0018F28BEC|nr:DUF1876 domain-containing protein [Nucisporomicrobium flavum]